MIGSKSTRRVPRHDNSLGLALLLSALLHAAIVAALLSSTPPSLPTPAVFEVSLEPPPPPAPAPQRNPSQKIVSESPRAPEIPPPDTDQIAARNARVQTEQLQRGTDGAAAAAAAAGGGAAAAPLQPAQPPQPPPQRQQPPAAAAKPQQPAPQKPPSAAPPERGERPAEKGPAAPPRPHTKGQPLKSLRLDDSTLAERFGAPPETATGQANPSGAPTDLREYRAFSRPQGSGASFLGSAGVSDHLPNLPDGDITLLNAKANTYAGFVRRVAVQVFAQLKAKGWERLSAAELRRLQDFTTIEAVLSPQGTLIRTNLVSGSGSESFDRVVEQSAATGARDPNPPPGAAASDGKIHFIFKARSWSQTSVDSRSGAPLERRWLLLATGLE